MLEIVEVHGSGLAEVVVRELDVSDFGGDDRLGAGRERSAVIVTRPRSSLYSAWFVSVPGGRWTM